MMDHGADNYVLDWIGFLPGKRESRRIVGDYVLKEQDLASARVFDDAIGYGGWHMDMHVVGGINTLLEPTEYILISEVYTIPYRSIYAKDIDNLYIGGRVISASHLAFGSTRIMGTCSILGQAIGVSAAIAKKNGTNPREVSKHIREIQQQLLRDDAYIPHFNNEDNCDIARTATVTCSSEKQGYEGKLVINGVARTVKQSSNLWCSDGISKDGEWLNLNFDMPRAINFIEIKFDSNLSKPIIFTLFNDGLSDKDWVSTPVELVKDYEIIGYLGEQVVFEKQIDNNYQRFNKVKLKKPEIVDCITLRIFSTHGCEDARIFEVRVY